MAKLELMLPLPFCLLEIFLDGMICHQSNRPLDHEHLSHRPRLR